MSWMIWVHVYIRHNFKQFKSFSKFWAWSESRLFVNVFSGVTTSGDSWSKRPTISKQITGILSGRMHHVSGHDVWKYTLHMKICQTPNTWLLSISFPFSGHMKICQTPNTWPLSISFPSAVCRNIFFNNEHIIWGFSRLVLKIIQNVSEFGNSLFRTALKIRLSKLRGYLRLPVYAVGQLICSNLILWLGLTINSSFNFRVLIFKPSLQNTQKGTYSTLRRKKVG